MQFKFKKDPNQFGHKLKKNKLVSMNMLAINLLSSTHVISNLVVCRKSVNTDNVCPFEDLKKGRKCLGFNKQ